MLDRTGVNLNDFPGGNLSGQPRGKFTEFFQDIELKYGVTKANREVYFKSSETFPCNNCNQYDWFVEKKFLGDVKFTLVVDLDKDCYSATLLPFVPHPNAKTTDVSLSTGFFDSYEAASGILGATTPEFKGAAVNGPVKYMKLLLSGKTLT